MADKFGLLLDADLIEDAIREKIKVWMNTYLLEVEFQRQLDPGSIPRPKSYLVAEEVDRELGDNLPSIIIASPGLASQPVKEGDGYYRATWNVALGVVVSAGGQDSRTNTKRLLRRYTSALRLLMLQKRNIFDTYTSGPDIDENFEVIDIVWMDESYDRLDFEDGQTMAAGEVLFEIEISNVANNRLGPKNPAAPSNPTEVGTSWGEVGSTDVTVIPVATDEEV